MTGMGCSNTEMSGGTSGARQKPKVHCAEVDKAKCGPLKPDVAPDGDGPALLDPTYLMTPALVVRKPNCIMCHAKVKGDVITDFNTNLSPFSARLASVPPADISQNVLIASTDGIRPINWNTAFIDGKLVLPQSEIPAGLLPFFTGATQGFTIEQALTTVQTRVSEGERSASPNGLKAFNNVGPSRDKSQPGVNEISAFKEVKIDPPTSAEIQAIISDPAAKEAPGSAAGLKIVTLGDGSEVTGLIVKTGAGGLPYAINNGAMTCKGDIVIGGSLVLKDVGSLTLKEKSCRLYVQKSVFIKGSLKADGDARFGIQIGAGQGIMAGVKYARSAGAETDAERNIVAGEIEDAGPQYYLVKLKTDGSLDKILATSDYDVWTILPTPGGEEFSKVSGAHWHWRSSERPSTPNCQIPGLVHSEIKTCAIWVTNPSFVDYTKDRKNANFDGVLFATQIFFSRYVGTVKGVIVADFALGALDRLNFESDNRFDMVPVLPKLKRAILSVKK